MHPSSLYSFVTSKKMIPVAVVVIILLAILFYGLENQTSQITTQSFVSPTPVSLDLTQQYKDPSNSYSISYPGTWKTVQTNSPVGALTFEQAQQDYRFTVSPPGQINPEGSENTTIEQRDIEYGGKLYTIQLWEKQGKPFYIVAIPKDIKTNPHFFSMQLPPQNTDEYIAAFGRIVASLKY